MAPVMAPARMGERRWFDARPWQTNAALIAIGLAMIGFTRQLISENDHLHDWVFGVRRVRNWCCTWRRFV